MTRGGASRVWVNGRMVADDEPSISAFDHGLLTGDGVFETMRVYGGVPFAARRHLERLGRSAAVMGLGVPDASTLRAVMGDVVEANGLVDGRLRITVTGGRSPLGSDRGDSGPTVVVAAGALAPWPPLAEVAVSPWPRNERGALAGVKSISYAENVVALAFAAERGAGEALFGNLAGHLCEGTGSNVFVGVDGRLVTPPLTAGCLAGVTRDLVMELVEVSEENLALSDLGRADEAFLTSSTREVQPIRAIDGMELAAAPGPLTIEAAAAFAALVKRDRDP